MKQQQIIYPLVAMALLVVGVGLFASRKQHDQDLQAKATALAEDLVTDTNSTRLVEIPSSLKDCLARLLSSPAGVKQVLLGDDESHPGGRRASARMVLTNASRASLILRVRAEAGGEQFSVLSFEMPTTPPR